MMLVLLQNAWSRYYAGHIWPREYWIEALWSSPTGRKLTTRILRDIPEERYWVDNTTPVCGELPSSVVKPSLYHVEQVIHQHGITSVLACGNQARKVAGQLWHGPLVAIPHPACRLTTVSMNLFNSQIQYMLSEASKGNVVRCAFTLKSKHLSISDEIALSLEEEQ